MGFPAHIVMTATSARKLKSRGLKTDRSRKGATSPWAPNQGFVWAARAGGFIVGSTGTRTAKGR